MSWPEVLGQLSVPGPDSSSQRVLAASAAPGSSRSVWLSGARRGEGGTCNSPAALGSQKRDPEALRAAWQLLPSPRLSLVCLVLTPTSVLLLTLQESLGLARE